MSYLNEKSEANIKRGFEGESVIREDLARKRVFHFQADLIVKQRDGNFCLYEIKHQEMFRAPPFDGHGLPEVQVRMRMEFEKHTGIKIVLVINCMTSKKIYWQYLKKLQSGEKYITGIKKRVIYPMKNFRVWNL